MSNWYLAYSKVRQEEVAAEGLEEQGYGVYLPKIRLKKRRAAGIGYSTEPLFPRYLFVSTRGADQSLAPAQYTRGVQKLVKFGDQLLNVPESTVAAIREREDPVSGYHRLEMPGLQKGDRVHIKSGAFAGVDAIFESRSAKDRVIVLLEILGQRAQAVLPIEELER